MTLSNRGFLLASLLCAVLACLIFLPGLPGGFVFDDAYNIVQNPGIQLQSLAPGAVLDAAFSAQPGSATRVLPMLTLALDYFRGHGLDPAVFKTTNIAIHGLTTLFIAWFLLDLLRAAGLTSERARWPALAMAAAWALHPLQVSAVLYVIQRMQTMATMFLVLALWAYLRARQAQIEGRSGRTGWMLSGLLWALAFGCKEDAILLPAYTLALELTVLRFRAADPSLMRNLHRGYFVSVIAGAALYALWLVPHYWHWDAYPIRDFSTPERLLSQGRVLCMYLWQMLLPLPSHLPFYYDWLQPSRGLLQPWTTLPALLFLAALLAAAWLARKKHPLFSLGIFLFFTGHFVTSNVIGLELAFEHRNHFPLIGIILAAGDLLATLAKQLRLRAGTTATACLLLMLTLGSTAALRAHSWDSDLALALTSTRLAPHSARAWNSLCVTYFERGGGPKADNPNLDKAIAACSKAADVGDDSIKSLTNIIAFKALRDEIQESDWTRYLDRLRHVTMTPDNASSIWVILNRVRDGQPIDGDRVLEAIDIINQREHFSPIESAAMGYFILGHTQTPERAYPYFLQAVLNTTDPKFADGLIEDLGREGKKEWGSKMKHERMQKMAQH